MSPTEAATLLTVAAAFDNRKPDADAAQAWARALDGLRFTDCREAIVKHFQGSSEWLMPKDVIAGVRRVRDQRVAEYGSPIPPRGLDPDNTVAWQAWYRQAIRDIADGTAPPPPTVQVDAIEAREVNYAELMPKVPADNDAITTARAGISAARADLCTLHRAKPCRICERARARDTESTQPEGASA